MAQKFYFAILRIEVTRASRGLSAIAELLVVTDLTDTDSSSGPLRRLLPDLFCKAKFHYAIQVASCYKLDALRVTQ